MKDIMKKIFAASKYDQKDLVQLALKLSEECGEVAQAVLSYSKAPACGYKNKTKENVLEEAWDCIITAGALIYRAEEGNVDEKFSEEMIEAKLKKWIDKSKKENTGL